MPPAAPTSRSFVSSSGLRASDSASFGLAHIAADEPAAFDIVAAYVDAGTSWVATQPDDRPVGYVLVDELDGLAHIEQVSVLPDQQGNGHGRALVERVAEWARATGRLGITLTTYGHIPWNRPLYEHLGFRVLDDADLGPELAARRADEAAAGMDPALRVAVRLDVGR